MKDRDNDSQGGAGESDLSDTFADEGPVEIQHSEAGSDPEVGHTPGKAEGVENPEVEGNE